jgi:adenylate cyclase class 2
VASVVQSDVYYNAPHRDFAETEEALRIRTETYDDDSHTELTYKGPLIDERSKTRREMETEVADDDAVANMLEALDFDPTATVRKDRDRYRYGEFTITLDHVDGLGEFVEVETETEDDVERARNDVHDLMGRLDLDPSEQLRTSYLVLLLDADHE